MPEGSCRFGERPLPALCAPPLPSTVFRAINQPLSLPRTPRFEDIQECVWPEQDRAQIHPPARDPHDSCTATCSLRLLIPASRSLRCPPARPSVQPHLPACARPLGVPCAAPQTPPRPPLSCRRPSKTCRQQRHGRSSRGSADAVSGHTARPPGAFAVRLSREWLPRAARHRLQHGERPRRGAAGLAGTPRHLRAHGRSPLAAAGAASLRLCPCLPSRDCNSSPWPLHQPSSSCLPSHSPAPPPDCPCRSTASAGSITTPLAWS